MPKNTNRERKVVEPNRVFRFHTSLNDDKVHVSMSMLKDHKDHRKFSIELIENPNDIVWFRLDSRKDIDERWLHRVWPSLPKYRLNRVDNYHWERAREFKRNSTCRSDLPVWKNSGQQNSVVPPKLLVYISGSVMAMAEPKTHRIVFLEFEQSTLILPKSINFMWNCSLIIKFSSLISWWAIR